MNNIIGSLIIAITLYYVYCNYKTTVAEREVSTAVHNAVNEPKDMLAVKAPESIPDGVLAFAKQKTGQDQIALLGTDTSVVDGWGVGLVDRFISRDETFFLVFYGSATQYHVTTYKNLEALCLDSWCLAKLEGGKIVDVTIVK